MIKLIGENIILKEMSLKDSNILYKLTQHPDLNKFSGPYTASISLKKAKEYIKNCKINIIHKKSYCLGIYLKNKKELIGNIGFINLDKKCLDGELGFWIGREYWGKGYMTQAVKIMTSFCLYKLNFKKVHAYFDKRNIGVKKILEKTGYKKELKSFIKNEVVLYKILKD